jgi:lipopolysaccharide biosynthesis glycosyltransferase
MRPEDFENLRVDKYLSIATYYRLFSPRVLPANLTKVLYLDSDIVVRRSLSGLWNTDLNDHALAAVEEFGDFRKTPRIRKFNAGVMLINLDFWRRNSVAEQAMAFARNHPEKVEWHDQDALNAVLDDRWIRLSAIWNEQTGVVSALRMEPARDAAIVHFEGPVKPWQWYWNVRVPHPLKYEYHRYRSRTPWRRYKLREGRAILPWRLPLLLRLVVNTLLLSNSQR